MRRRLAAAALVALLPLSLAGCDAEDDTVLTVRAAASLSTVFEQLADDFEAAHEGVRVDLVVGGSSDLAAQVVEGAPTDVFASADEITMERLTAEGLHDGEPRTFAANTLRVVTPPGNPAGLTSLGDLARPGLALVVCAPQVPCGAATVEFLAAAGVEAAPVSEEQSVTDVLAKVSSGEADAGLVYATDVRQAGNQVEDLDLPGSPTVRTVYPLVRLAGSEEPALAREFVDLVLADPGQVLLAEAGFLPAPAGDG